MFSVGHRPGVKTDPQVYDVSCAVGIPEEEGLSGRFFLCRVQRFFLWRGQPLHVDGGEKNCEECTAG